ncbi:MAG TPA: PAS domain S-box protein, partial [Gemmataceae bacterium]|nr:PAS domain S-box protein [Gemmataceae bacterium]
QSQNALLHYRELFEFAPDCYLVTDLAGNIREANHAAALLFGRAKPFLLGKPLPFLVAREGRRDFYTRLGRLVRAAQPVQDWEVRLQPFRGPARVALVSVAVVLDAAAPAELRWLIRDVTEQRQAEADRRRERAFAEYLVETAEVAVAIAGAGGEIRRANAYLQRLSGYGEEELLGQDWCALLLPAPEQGPARADLREAFDWGKAAHRVRLLRTRDGRLRSVAWSMKPLPEGGAEGPSVLLIGHDVTELHEAQHQALRLERLAAIGQMAAGLAHESRNALQRGMACLERLRWTLQGQPAALDLVDRTRKAQDDLVRLYEDVREYAAPLRLDVRPCEVAGVWRQAWAELLAVNPERAAVLAEEGSPGDSRCPADGFRLKQVFLNLLENALAACADPVRVVIGCRPAELAGRPALEIRVRDNGPGFPPEQRASLFEPFHTTKTRGTGLGLAIAKRIVEAHGGQITAGDAPQGGAEIILTLPRRPS